MSDVPPAASAPPANITLEDAIRAGQHLQRTGKLEDAQAVYQEILALVPDEPNTLHYLGVLRHQQNRNDEALDLIRRAAERLPGDSGPWVNLGNVLLEMQRFDEAIDAYKAAAECAPDNVLIYNNLGLLHTRRSSFDLAEQCYQRALALAPQSEFVLMNFGRLRQRQGRYQEAIAYSMKSIATNPKQPAARRLLAISHTLLGDEASARQVLREWMAQEPDNPQPRHLLAGVGGVEVPARASDEYIVSEFDSFSNSFDAKLEALGYRAPELVAAALARATAPAASAGDILDAGCGTGLCAPHLRPLAARLDGVDLSAGMLAKALQRGGYDELKQAELTEFLAYYPARWNAVVSADTLCYFGDLAPVFAAAHAALRTRGWLVFSFSIQYHGRYAHTRAYLEQSLRQAGYTAPAIEAAILRMEVARPVNGWVVAAQKAPA
jgi:predicted TPR repeat methyltransferase